MVLPTVLASVALGLAATALVLVIVVARRLGTRDPMLVPPSLRSLLRVQPGQGTAVAEYLKARDDHEVVAFIANPIKPGVAELREQALRACSIRYLPQPIWLYTTPDDAGDGLARQAIEAGADVVVAIGGDGTVRAVAGVAAEKNVPMGIIPMGTGNILARNLDLPLGDTQDLLRTALDGDDTAVDVGWMELTRPDGTVDSKPHIFLVMAGAGLDAEMVHGADDSSKKKLGWIAYFFAAIRHMRAKRITVSVGVDGAEPVTSQMRTVLFANCGKLPGGLQLVPEASLRDGTLDVATIDARGGIVGWTELFGTVVAQGAGLKQPQIPKEWRASRIDHVRGKEVLLNMETPQRVQADGESLGKASSVRGWVDPGVLTVRLPRAKHKPDPQDPNAAD